MVKSYSILLYTFAAHHEKTFFLSFLRSLLITYLIKNYKEKKIIIPVFTSAVLIALMLVGPSKCLKQLKQIELNRVRIPTGRKQTRWPFTSMAKDLNSGLS